MKYKIFILLFFITLSPLLTTNKVKAEGLKDTDLYNSPISLNLELSSRYIWRGQEYGNAPLGFATLSYSNNGFSIWAMGAYTIDDSHQEVDLGVTYTYGIATLGISDYYYPSAPGYSDNYFDFNNHTTGHWGEAYVTINPIKKLPIWVTASCYVYGADKKPDGKQAFSSYAELGYSYQFKDDNALSLAIGSSLNRGFYTNYEKGFSVVNIDLSYSTAFKFGNFKLPVKGSYILSPAKEKSFFKFSTYFNL